MNPTVTEGNMLKRKPVIYILLCVMMCTFSACISGCSTGTSPSPSPTPALTPAASAPPPGDGSFKLPIADEKKTFEIWSNNLVATTGMKSANDSLAYAEIEKRTNIHIEWDHPTQGTESEQFGLIVASQSYPDSFMTFYSMFTGGFDKFINDGVILDLKDIITVNAPNYEKIRSADDVYKLSMTDEGRVPFFRAFKQTFQPSWMGPVTREDFLAALDTDEPKTYDDYYAYLKALKNSLQIEAPLSISSTGIDDSFLCGRNISSAFYHIDGQVLYGPMQPEFKEYIEMMAKWYDEGLIDREFFTRNSPFGLGFDSSYISTGKVGVFNTAYSWIDYFKVFSNEPDFMLVAIMPPVRNQGDKRLITISQFVPATRDQTSVGTITPQCKDAQTLAKWFDYFYTEEGALLANYGIEGTSYEMVNGEPVITEVIYKNPDGLSINDALSKYAVNQTQAFYYDWRREISPEMSKNALEAGPKWDSNWTDERTMPVVSVATDESAEFAGIMNDVNTYLNETVVKFITGEKKLDSFDDFISTMEELGIGRAIEIQQDALARYNKR